MLISKKIIMFLVKQEVVPEGTQTKTCDRNSKGTNLRPFPITYQCILIVFKLLSRLFQMKLI